MKILISALLVLSFGCVDLARSHMLASSYQGKPIDAFIKEHAMVPDSRTPLDDGGAIYAFHGGPGGEDCKIFFTTDAKGIIVHSRLESCS
jgi:hypothetical protein